MKIRIIFAALALASPAAALQYPNEHFGGLTLDAPLAVTSGGLGNSAGNIAGLNFGGVALSGNLCLLNASCTWSGQQLFGVDWLSAIVANTVSGSTLAVVATNGAGALMGASRTSPYTSPGHMGTLATSGFAINDNATYANGAWAFYGEARSNAGVAGSTIGEEVDIINEGATVSVNPYTPLASAGRLTIGYWSSSGRNDVSSSAPASLSYGMTPNGSNFTRGIVAMSGAVVTPGSVETGEIVAMPSGTGLAWYAPDGNEGAYVYSSVFTGYNEGQALQFTNTGLQYQTPGGLALLSVVALSGAVNGASLTAATTGNIPILSASGTDSSIAFAIRSKGNTAPLYLQAGNYTTLQINGVNSAANYFGMTNTASGGTPTLSATGADTNVGMLFSPQGSGGIAFGTNGTLVNGVTVQGAPTANIPIVAATGSDAVIPLAIRSKGHAAIYLQGDGVTGFEVGALAGGVNYLEAVTGTAGNPPQLSAQGSDTNIGIALKPQGTGVVSVGGSGSQLPSFTVSTLPSCVAGLAGTIAYVTDATAPSYNATLAGGGAVKTLALCNGSAWTAH